MKKTIFATDRLTMEERKAQLGDSSGIILEENDDTVKIGYVDFDVSEFGGSDYECFYDLDVENTVRFKSALSELYQGDLFEMCASAFTVKLSNSLFEAFCIKHGIVYQKNTY